MIIKTIDQKLGKEWVRLAWWAWTWVLPLGILLVIGTKIFDHPDQIGQLKDIQTVGVFGLVASLLLLPLNVSLEALKWKVILRPIENKSLPDCLKIILSGRSLNVISPFGMGDAFAKYAGTANKYRIETLAGMVVDRFSQLLPTLSVGLVSFVFLLKNGVEVPWSNELFWILLAALVLIAIGVVFLFLRAKLRKYLTLITALNRYSIFEILMLSFGRYLVFMAQFLLIFRWLGSDLPTGILMLGIGWIFLIKTILPSLSVLGDLVKRELSALFFFSFFATPLGEVILASFIIWLINLVLPAIVGIAFVHQFKKAF